MIDPLKPSTTLLVKLGSIIVHADEGLSEKKHTFDICAFKSLLSDDEVLAWLKEMDRMALLPKKR